MAFGYLFLVSERLPTLCCWVTLPYLVSTGVHTQFAFIPLHAKWKYIVDNLSASGWLVTTVTNAL